MGFLDHDKGQAGTTTATPNVYHIPLPIGLGKPVMATPLTGNQWILLQSCNAQPPIQPPGLNQTTSSMVNVPQTSSGGHGGGGGSSSGIRGTSNSDSADGESSGGAGGSQTRVKRKRNSPTPWTEEEHRLFLQGLKKYGKGNWRIISAELLKTRTPIQIASHAQKYFEHISGASAKRRRTSIFATDGSLVQSGNEEPIDDGTLAMGLVDDGKDEGK